MCHHGEREGIERDLLMGGTFRGVARHWGLSSDAVRRHVGGHLQGALQEEILTATGSVGLDLASRVLEIAESARDVRLDSEADSRTAIAAGRAELDALAVLADRLGIRQADISDSVQDASDLVTAVATVAPANPEVLDLLALGLEARGRTGWAWSYRETAKQIRASKADDALDSRSKITDATEARA